MEFRKVIFAVRDQCLCAVEFSPGQFSSSVRSRFIRGLIELIFGENVLNSLIFIVNGEDWNWSSEQWCLCPRTVTLFCEISLLFYASRFAFVKIKFLEI